jgi:uncharacterized membrane protein YgdD (TMEM256/DUF423 family)
MNGRDRALLGLAALNGLAAVAAGAFSEHGAASLAGREWLKTAAEYGMIHSLAVFASFVLIREGSRTAEVAGWLFLAGGAAFSGSLDLLAIAHEPWAAVLTPVGGLLLLTGWAVLAFAAFSGVRAKPL